MKHDNNEKKYSVNSPLSGRREEKPPYQTPVAMPLGELATGSGQDHCQPLGNSAGGKCQDGNTAGTVKCQFGNMAYEGKCDTGNNAPSGTCQFGNFAQGCNNGNAVLGS